MNLFLDESGECSFSAKSAYTHFLITIVSIDPSKLNKLKNSIKRQNARIIKNGWDKTREIKAYELYKNKKFGPSAIYKMLKTLTKIESLEVSYIVVNKEKITNESFRKASYGIGYNYFTGVLVSELIFEDAFHKVHLIYDKKNKETHENKHFREYLETKIFGNALEKDISVDLLIEGHDSHNCYGLTAVDYFCWSIFRKFEHGDVTFFKLFTDKLKRRREWYI